MKKYSVMGLLVISALFAFSSPQAQAKDAAEIRAGYDKAITDLKFKVLGSEQVLKQAKGVLVIPGMWKFGIGVGGEYGEGELRVGGNHADYYSYIGASIGWQLGVQKRSIIIAIMDDAVLDKFRTGDGWEFGVDGSATLIESGIDGDITTMTHNKPMVVFVINAKGLMANLTLEGAKLTKIKKQDAFLDE